MVNYYRILVALVFACTLLVQPLTAHAQVAKNSPLNDTYTVSGVNPADNEPYRAVLEVKQSGEDTYRFRWSLSQIPEQFGGGYVEAYGYGFIIGNELTLIVVDNNGTAVIARYVKQQDDSWRGVWSTLGSDVLSVETLTPTTDSAEKLKLTLPTPDVKAL